MSQLVYRSVKLSYLSSCPETGWETMGSADNARLIKANFTSSSNPRYSRLPLDRPLPLAKGETRSVFPLLNPVCPYNRPEARSARPPP